MGVIQAAAPEQEAEVIALWEAWALTRPWNDPVADYRRAVDGAASAVLVMREGGRLAGSVMVGHDGHRGWVYYLAVAPAQRRRGIGRRLMAEAEAWLKAAGAPKLLLMVREGNDAALAFYDAIGLERQPVITFGRFLNDGSADKAVAGDWLRVDELRCTGKFVPTQFEGRLADGRPLYIRQRHGPVTIGIGPVGGTGGDAVSAEQQIEVYASHDDPAEVLVAACHACRLIPPERVPGL